jgi:prolyl 4-hydroxylase
MLADSLDLTCPLVWTVPAVLSAEECDALIARIEAARPARAPITTARGFELRPDVRNNARVMFDDPALASTLFSRLRSRLPDRVMGLTVHGANERIRCYRYQPGQRFAPHFDGAFHRSESEESLLTLMVYLNEGFGGGATGFPDLEQTIVPVRGTALLFQHMLLHEGCVVTSGVKYALRSDVMFRRATPQLRLGSVQT